MPFAQSTQKRSIELLSPARDLACAKAAVDHGADAVYIGAPRFGARQSAGNSVEDIQALCDYAHPFGVRVYVTLNTLLFESEVVDTIRLAWQLYEAGVDAFIVQDMALLSPEMPPVPLHASTQMDNRSAEKAQWLYAQGFRQLVLARELSLQEISAIHQAAPDVLLEAFCHGALCVSYSGRCQASQYCYARSANRGECAQFCRMPYHLIDADGREIAHDKHLLSLRDMNRSEHLEAMIDAGVSSFKIEGRLKDVAYVKTVTAYYRKKLDEIIRRRPDLQSSSLGHSRITFEPDLQESFSRGYTDYFLNGKSVDLASWDTPKSKGKEVGYVKEVRGKCIIVAGTTVFHNGDGLCFTDAQGALHGFRVNSVEGNHLYPLQMPAVKKGDILWRNHNHEWERMMESTTAERKIAVRFSLSETNAGLRLTAEREDGKRESVDIPFALQPARQPQDESIRQTLSKLGDTPYEAQAIDILFSQPWFVPRSILADARRMVLNQFTYERIEKTALHGRQVAEQGRTEAINVSNTKAEQFYLSNGFTEVQKALEVQAPKAGDAVTLMTCRYCLRHQLGYCSREGKRLPFREPLTLVGKDGRHFTLSFDCKECEMRVIAKN